MEREIAEQRKGDRLLGVTGKEQLVEAAQRVGAPVLREVSLAAPP